MSASRAGTVVTVVGLGKIGLPLAVAIAEAGHHVAGADIDAAVVDSVNRGVPPFPNEAELDDRLRRVVDAGTLSATVDTASAVAGSDVVVVVVPLVVDDAARPDFAVIDTATRSVGEHLRPGTLVSYETTLPVGTTRARFTPALAEASGLTPGKDLFVVHSPERVFSGRVFADLRRYPKLVGGIDAGSAERGAEFYRSFLRFDPRPDLERPNGVWNLGAVEAAEMAKLAETSYRDLNIAFANQLALGAERLGVDVAEVIAACNSQPFSHIHQPGIAVGGHCIPVYPHLLAHSVPEVTLSLDGRAVNASMPAHAVAQVAGALGRLGGARVVVLGAAYRPGVKEHAFSGVFDVVAQLRAAGATVTVQDPLYTDDELRSLGLDPHTPGTPVDAVILQAAHDEYTRLRPDEDFPGVRVVYDGRRALDRDVWPSSVAFLATGTGRGTTP